MALLRSNSIADLEALFAESHRHQCRRECPSLRARGRTGDILDKLPAPMNEFDLLRHFRRGLPRVSEGQGGAGAILNLCGPVFIPCPQHYGLFRRDRCWQDSFYAGVDSYGSERDEKGQSAAKSAFPFFSRAH
jgi:hypothetical protein